MSGRRIAVLRWIGTVTAFWVLFVLLPSIPPVRERLAAPLVVHDDGAKGDACYVLAGGTSATWERLDAAADLYQMGRAPRIVLMRDDHVGAYDFKSDASWTATRWAIDRLVWRGVPKSAVTVLDPVDGFFGTLQEARNVAAKLPPDVRKLVVVSSAPHMRRAVLAFRRSLPPAIEVVPYAASPYLRSAETFFPLWVEYAKYLVYLVVA